MLVIPCPYCGPRDEHEFSRFARGGKDRVARWSGFSELELDRYEDVNILARTLTEGSMRLHAALNLQGESS